MLSMRTKLYSTVNFNVEGVHMIKLHIVHISSNRVQLSIDAPKEVLITKEEPARPKARPE